jgi:hypothetical protein
MKNKICIFLFCYKKMDNKIYCYLRVSTGKQYLQSNKAELLLKVNDLNLNSQNIVWIEETVSGMKK